MLYIIIIIVLSSYFKFKGFIIGILLSFVFHNYVLKYFFNSKDNSVPKEDIVEPIKGLNDAVNIISPEKRYSKPRKIDWENINKTRQITGMKGEEIALEMEKIYLKSINRNDLSEKVKHVSKEDGDGYGYDILSFLPDGSEKYIEVKSTIQSNTNSFNISRNELNFMKDNKNNTYIYKIYNVNENDDVPTLEIINAETVLSSDQIIPTQYIVKL